ncbi:MULTISPECIES: MOSC domain-containing protein [unclassified Sporosarcina]|uniref:MOSC domain-containing protein n=1 Tax=unclassified Sporosarcina TaxID=2647733 RepID=UPI00203B132A|nr:MULTISPECIES: MOSC N-terminal beta barrel domain-containing protein [unclassified Sporosarcina]GKV64464.1 molybdenum cofactor biosynthesis protein [Sporosarcina sp. NCCP-2331]GLB55209.1 molybdenum cofactor biosynthesis protein [Sporosarcina sp. NCCP-2378]
MKLASLWRYPVKSMMGEEMNACEITEKGVRGDRGYGVVDAETGRLANAKNPKKWPEMFYYRAAFTDPAIAASVRITLPTGETVLSTDEDVNRRLSESFGRDVHLAVPTGLDIEFEGYIPEGIEELENPGTVFSRTSPNETFFDIAMVHLITTSTIDKLRELAPESRIEPRRFRPNLILDTPDAEGFIEEEWVGKTLWIGDEVQLRILQPTKRCVMTTLPQGDLPRDPNVLRTLARQNDGNFGVYAEVIQPGRVQIGDLIRVGD